METCSAKVAGSPSVHKDTQSYGGCLSLTAAVPCSRTCHTPVSWDLQWWTEHLYSYTYML